MAAWKQIVLALVVLAAAAAAWLRFVPGAPETLAGWGIDNGIVAAIAPERSSAEAAPGDRQGAGGGNRAGGRGGGPQAVVTRPVGQATINDRLAAIGTGRAVASVTVKPYAAGRLTEITVSSGQKVSKGDVIARVDADAEEIAVARAGIAVKDAQSRLQRAQALQRANTATSVQVADAQLVVSNAELAERDAELALARRTITAPIGGVIGIIPVEIGNAVTADTTVATIDDRSAIVIDFWVPERFAGAVDVGEQLTATPIANPGSTFQGSVSAVDNRLDEASRTLRVQARIDNPQDRLRAGQSFQIAMRFPGDTFASVDPLAVQWGTDGAFVWAVRDGKAARTPVRIIQRNTENVLVEAALEAGDAVVTEGVYAVRDGGPVQVANERNGGSEPAAAPSASKGPRAGANTAVASEL